MQYVGLTVLLLWGIASNEALRILVSFPMTSRSHGILGHGIVEHLLNAGHEVVHITANPMKQKFPNLKEIDVSSIASIFEDMKEEAQEFRLENMINKGNIANSRLFLYIAYIFHKKLLEDPGVTELLNDPNEKFDAVILEWFFSEMTVGIPALFEAPLIWAVSTEPHWKPLRLIDEIINPAYSVDTFTPYKAPLNFWQRAEQFWKTFTNYIILNFIIFPAENLVYNSVYPEIAAKRGITMPSYSDALYNGSLMFFYSHPSLGGSMKLPQNAVNVAGYHVDENVEPLPKDLQKLMDDAKHGVIYFSLGSVMQTETMSEEMKQSLLNMLSKLKQTVIWKFEADVKNVPANVHLLKWTPQQAILTHPNLKLFITHGGQLSVTEAVHYGIPLIVIPIMADQYINMASVVDKGFGVSVMLNEDLPEKLESAIVKVLSDEKYTTKAKEVSAMYHDRPMKPDALINYWVEYVVRTRGAPHLRSPALTVPLYQRLYLDLLALIVVVLFLVLKLVQYVLKMRSKKSPKKNKND